MLDLKHILKDELSIDIKSPLVVSVSGGMDSMALLNLLMKTPYELNVVHFNHQKRDAAIYEKDLVESFCNQHRIKFHYYVIKVGEGNFHHQAHILRQKHLKEVAKRVKTPYILTAHHLDDLLENVLIKLTRGSNLLGYAGMQPIFKDGQYFFVKPLLYASKHDIITYVNQHKISYLEDDSNHEDDYLRNRYRHAVVPIIKQENEQLLEQVKQYHHQLTNAFHFMRETTVHHLSPHLIINIETFKTWHEALKEDSIAYLIEQHQLNLSYEIIQKIKEMLLSNKPNQTYTLSKNYQFVKAYHEAFIKPLTPKKNVKIKLHEGNNNISNMAIFTFLTKSATIQDDFSKLCYNKLAFPLILRHRVEGDTLAYAYGHKKLKKLLIDHKVPTAKRDSLWVLTDHDNVILWVENLYINQTLGNDHSLYFKLKEVNKNAS